MITLKVVSFDQDKEPDGGARSVSSRDFSLAGTQTLRIKNRTTEKASRKSRHSHTQKKRAATEKESMKLPFSLQEGKKADSFNRISESQEYSLGPDSKLDDSRPSIDQTPIMEPNSIMTGNEYTLEPVRQSVDPPKPLEPEEPLKQKLISGE